MSELVSEPSSDKASDFTSSPVPKPGKLLRRERLEKKWTKEHVAKTLLLSVQHVAALENDEYDKLPGTTYVVGYWRNYANLLKIDISESIEFHKNNLEISPSAIALKAGHRHAHNYQEQARKRSGWIFLVLSVIFLGGIWYWQNPIDTPLNQWLNNQAKTDVNNDDNQPAIKEITPVAIIEPGDYSNVLSDPNFSDDMRNADEEADVEEVDATTAEEDNLENDKDVPLNLSPNPNPNPNPNPSLNLNLNLNPSPSPNNRQTDSQDVVPAQQETESESMSSTEAVTEVENENENTTENITELADETPVADSPNWIFLSVEKESWLDVRDVIGNKLIYRIANVGESISLKGQPPFYVFIGTADGVRVEYLGKPIRFKIEDDSPIARFGVGRVEIKKTNDQ